MAAQRDRQMRIIAPFRHRQGKTARAHPSSGQPDKALVTVVITHGQSPGSSFVFMAANLTELYNATAAGDKDAFNQLYDELKGLVAWAIRNVGVYGPDAEDIFQTTWTKFFEHLGRLRDPRALPGWLVTVARNECIGRGRLAGREVPVEEFFELEVDELPPDMQALHALDVEALDRVMEELDERERQLVALWAHGASYKEMDKAIGIPAGSVGPTLARIREKLATMMKEQS